MMRYRVGLLAGLVGLALSVAGSAEAQYPQISTYCNSGGTWIPCTNSGGGGGSGGTTQDDDDASIAAGQNVDIVGGLSMVFDGSVWRRLTFGTAGTASSQVLTVQGIASMTPLSANVAQVNGNTVDVGTGTAGTGTPRVAVASDSSITVNAGTNLNTSALLTTAAFQTAFGTGSVVSADPCEGGTKVSVPISQATSTQLFTGTASNRTYVCSVVILQPADSEQTYSLVSGTGSVCATSTSALIGATSAANGMSVPFTAGNGGATIAKTDTDADNVCLLQSSTDRINGVITYVVAP